MRRTRRQFLKGAASTTAALAGLKIITACEVFDVDDFGTGAGSFVTPATSDDWYYFSGVELPENRAPRTRAADWNLELSSGGRKIADIDLPKLREIASDGHQVAWMTTLRSLQGPYVQDIIETRTATGLFRGVLLSEVLDRQAISGDAAKLRLYGADGFTTSIPVSRTMVEDAPVFLAWELNGAPLSSTRGGPVRLIVPGAWGFKSIPWITAIDATTDFSTFGTFETGRFAGRANIDNPGDIALMNLVHHPNRLRGEVPGPDIRMEGLALVGGGRIVRVDVSVDQGAFQQARIGTLEQAVQSSGRLGPLVYEADQFGTQEWPWPNVWAPWSFEVNGLSPGRHNINVRVTDDRLRTTTGQSMDIYSIAEELRFELTIT